MKNFPDGVMSYNEFRDLSSRILDPSEVDAFCRNVFRMFDSNKDANLTFDEFTIATSAKDSSPAEKLVWLFDHVYDKVSYFFQSIFSIFYELKAII
jgi:Ca2+-binding EF-hand superfamily protein